MNPLWVSAWVSVYLATSVLRGRDGTSAEGRAVLTQVNHMSWADGKQRVKTAASGALIGRSGTQESCYIYAPREQSSDHNRLMKGSHQLVQIGSLCCLVFTCGSG